MVTGLVSPAPLQFDYQHNTHISVYLPLSTFQQLLLENIFQRLGKILCLYNFLNYQINFSQTLFCYLEYSISRMFLF